MKKILSIIVALCLLLPMGALGEAAANPFLTAFSEGKALVTEVSFTPGTLPGDLAAFQAMYADLLKALGFKTVVQNAQDAQYQNFDLLLSGESVLSLGTLLKDGKLNVLSELLGDKTLAFTKDELISLLTQSTADMTGAENEEAAKAQIASVVGVLFGESSAAASAMDMDKLQAELALLGMDIAQIVMPYMQKATVTQGEFTREGADKGVSLIEMTLNGQDIRDLLEKIGKALQKSETLMNYINQSLAASGERFEETWESMVKEYPDNAGLTISVALDQDGGLAYMVETVQDGDKAVGEIVITKFTKAKTTEYTVTVNSLDDGESETEFVLAAAVANDQSQADIEMQIEDDALVRIKIKADAAEGKADKKLDLKIEVYEINEDASLKQLLVPQVNFGISIVYSETDSQIRTDVTFLWEDKAIVTLNVKYYITDAVALPDTANAVHMAQLSQEELGALFTEVAVNAQTVLQNAMTKLPESVLTLISSLMGGAPVVE